MPVNFCLLKEHADRFRAALKSGEINPEKLANMESSQARHDFLAKYVGENAAKDVNALFESKLLLKNQKAGFISWAQKSLNDNPKLRNDLISKIQRMDKVLNADDLKSFKADLIEQKLGVRTTLEETKAIANMSKKVEEASIHPDRTSESKVIENKNFTPNKADLQYGIAREELNRYIGDIKNNANKIKFADFGGAKSIRIIPKTLAEIDNLSRQANASLDNSFVARQGAASFWTNNKEWRAATQHSFQNLVKGFKNPEEAQAALDAYAMSHPLYDKMIQDGLSIKGVEEALPKSLIEKVKYINKPFSASEIAYNGMAHELRMSIYTKNIAIMAKQGIDVSKSTGQTKGLAQLVNSLTGSGKLRFGLEKASKVVSIPFFSAKFLQSNFDKLFLHPIGSGVGGTVDFALRKEGAVPLSYAQKVAAFNLLKMTAGTASILALANTLKPGSVEYDPRSSDFGKIRIGDTRFDITGGMGSIITLAARQWTGTTKSSGTGKITALDSGAFGAPTRLDSILSFFESKTSPIASIIRDATKGKDMQGNKFNFGSELGGLFTPLGLKNFQELQSNPNAANTFVAVLLDSLGVSSNTYSPSGQGSQGSSWSQSSAKDLVDFKAKVGNTAFEAAGQKFDDKYNTWISTTRKDPRYLALPETEKQAAITLEKNKIQKDIFANANFKYKAVKTDKNRFNALLN